MTESATRAARILAITVLVVFALLGVWTPLRALGAGTTGSFIFASIDAPVALKTVAIGINSAGDIVGAYFDAQGAQHGFLLSQGQFTRIDDPLGIATNARGVGPGGDIVGLYVVSPGTSLANWKGFLYSRGIFSTVLFSGRPGAIPQTIMPNGMIYGCFHDSDFGASMYGAVWSRFGDTSLATGGGELADVTASVPASMNTGATPDGSMVVGLYADSAGHGHGYIVQNGVFRSYDVPGSSRTSIWGMNATGDFVGVFGDGTGTHGFLQPSDGSAPIVINFPGATATVASGINNNGAIVGQYTDASGTVHGFLAEPASQGLEAKP